MDRPFINESDFSPTIPNIKAPAQGPEWNPENAKKSTTSMKSRYEKALSLNSIERDERKASLVVLATDHLGDSLVNTCPKTTISILPVAS